LFPTAFLYLVKQRIRLEGLMVLFGRLLALVGGVGLRW
jgi:hypothetical protein